MPSKRAVAVFAAGVLAPAVARADPPARPQRTQSAAPSATTEGGVTVRTDRDERERERVEGATRFATSVIVGPRGRVVESLADVLDEAPGLHARRSGDGLAPTAVTLRGAPAGHVTLALDGVVLNDASSEGVDLSLVPPSITERVDIYRGAAPVRLGVAGLGGTLELVTRAPGVRPSASLWAGYGSFGQRRAGAAITARAGTVSTLLSIGYRGTRGDFTFFNHGGTDQDPRDDTEDSPRINNAADALDVLARVCAGPRHAQSCATATYAYRERGLPGPGASPVYEASVAQSRLLLRAGFRGAVGAGHLEAYAAGTFRRSQFRDYAGEGRAGRAFEARDAGTTGELGLTGALYAGSVRVDPVARVRLEGFGARTLPVLIDEPPTAMNRVTGLIGADTECTVGRVTVAPAFAAEAMGDWSDTADARPSPPRVLPSPRLGVRVAVTSWLELRANVAHLERAPTLPELFGVPGTIAGNRALAPEVSDGADVGAVARARRGSWDVRAEAAGFARHARDLIVLVRNTFVSLKPFNLRAADIFGAEALVRVAYGRAFSLVASYALTHATMRSTVPSYDGRRVPSIPTHDVYARATGTLGPVGLSLDASYVSGIYLDEANSDASPPRLLLGAAVSFAPAFARGFALTLMATNLLDQRAGMVSVAGSPNDVRHAIGDFAGYPLPGRAFFVSLSFNTEVPR